MERTTMGVAAAAIALGCASPSGAVDVLFYHEWSSPSEVAALNVLKSDWEAKDPSYVWKDFAVPHDQGASISLMNLIAGGTPPTAFLQTGLSLYETLEQQGLDVPLDETFTEAGATPNFPPAVAQAITVDGKILKAPLGVHSESMIYYNLEAAKKAGVDPASWTSLDDLWADFDKIQAAGIIPLAIGGEKWQLGQLFEAFVAAEAGPEIFTKIYGLTPDPSAIDTPGVRAALDRFREVSLRVDAGSPNRKWNDTTNLVITGQALAQLHGDWMKGEFRAAGKVPGKDFGCIKLPGAKAMVVIVDAWGFVRSDDPKISQAQLDFASTVVDPTVNADFAAAKGATPVRLDVPTDKLDQCNTAVLDVLGDPTQQVPNPVSTADPDWYNAIWDAADTFFNKKDESPDEFIQELQSAYEQILG